MCSQDAELIRRHAVLGLGFGEGCLLSGELCAGHRRFIAAEEQLRLRIGGGLLLLKAAGELA